ncbi:helix-turn-helix domain-containing protein [Gynuella sunshinyii]|uniref:Putative transcriptional regulator n=1 Tax=Gynuella sunshinyii YC6258 TaxID=1445510 RepID=A0A0C5VTY4_9GAMM|nr:XRE family transcriptional regulator [Gynuella sunshinyii]AJQ93809.1 putative transcriptional regulator [Gynuella sunshinyii YC6258]
MEFSQQVASGLKQLRKQYQWSLDTAAKKTGVSKAMLGQIERGESSPTLNTLWKIARGYELSFSQLMALTAGTEGNRSGTLYQPAGSLLRVQPLIPYDPQMKIELLQLELMPGYMRKSTAHEPGVIEHVIVISGHLSILSEDVWHSLEPGQAFHFDANCEHGYRNDSDLESTIFHNLIFYPQGRVQVKSNGS